ncbi:hypothetical protein LY90DRAFT_700389 [Neocallimastix californiae]|uniref:tRNA (N(6)-L-threonylcarbamoyladenosine(37)-C(2))-methylthiotransferase n=1 Tax=Neocallimastix californiae TaxID=1754190 RepID=A0A1Y2E990_9FUNG|nr:hypothetical protein LY90DRAFT_700389 [Neocallimastix californiae]|eukprot:ORY68112.1 hypothetical protein LY90DRAFT_700389 [Neocallimastix californiae]
MNIGLDENVDIEDLHVEEVERREEEVGTVEINSVVLNNNNNVKNDNEKATDDKFSTQHFLPGNATIYIRSWGCSHNNSDSEYMAGLLKERGYKIIFESVKKYEADLWLLNSCTVKNPSEQTFVNEIENAKRHNILVVLAGCVPQASQKDKRWKPYTIIGVQQIDKVVEAVEETLKGNTVRYLREKKKLRQKLGGADLELPKIRKNPLIEIIPISTGCLNECTYCKTKAARGGLGSYPIDVIVERVKSILKQGVVEIWITSEDVGAYGIDIEHVEEMAKILSHPRVYSFIHIPVQSGSDSVLDAMKRKYTVAEFKKVVNALTEGTKEAGGITIATDIICGFPTETEEDFEKTMDLMREFRFPVTHISQFYPRPGTPAAKMTRIPTGIVKNRSRKITNFFESYEAYGDEIIGTEQEVLVTEINSGSGDLYVAHNRYYNQVLVPRTKNLLGKLCRVRITKKGKYFLMGEVIEVLKFEGYDNEEVTEEEVNNKKRLVPKFVRKKRNIVSVKSLEEEDDKNRREKLKSSSTEDENDDLSSSNESNNEYLNENENVTETNESSENSTHITLEESLNKFHFPKTDLEDVCCGGNGETCDCHNNTNHHAHNNKTTILEKNTNRVLINLDDDDELF